MKWLVWIVLMIAPRGYPQITILGTEPARVVAASELDDVVRRATEYVTKYEAELGDIIGTEDYLQTSTWPTVTNVMSGNPLSAGGPGLRGAISSPNSGAAQQTMPPTGPTGRTMQRQTAADFLIMRVGSEWVALRDVHAIDGKEVKKNTAPIDSAFDDSPANNTKQFNRLKTESTKYNIGDVFRETNLPTFALHVLRKEEVGRFSFQKAGGEEIGGTLTWKVSFTEMTGPALVVSRKDEDLFSSGALWIDPDDGRVLKTEFVVENKFAKPRSNHR